MTRASDTAKLLGAGATILDGTTISTADNTAQLTLTSTDADDSGGPILDLFRNSSSPADGDALGLIRFKGEDAGGNETTYAQIVGFIQDEAGGAEDGTFKIETLIGGSSQARLNMESTSTVFNEGGADIDFRVEGNNSANLLFIDGGNDHICINTSTDAGGVLNIKTTDNTANLVLFCTDADAVVGPILSMKRDSSSPADNDALGYVKFVGENDASEEVQYVYMQANAVDVSDGTEDGAFEILTQVGGAGKSRINLEPTETVFNDTSADLDFRVESNSESNMLFVNAGNDAVGIGTNDPQVDLEVRTGVTSRLRVSGAANTNSKVEIGYDNSTGPYIKAGSSGTNKLQVYVDNTSLAAEFRGNGDFYSNDGSVHSLSDSRIKKDIADLTDGLDIVKQLKPRTFKYNGKATTLDDDRTRYGFVADEVMAIASQYVSEETQTIDGVEVDDFKSLSTTKMIPMLVKAIQELSAKVTTLENA